MKILQKYMILNEGQGQKIFQEIKQSQQQVSNVSDLFTYKNIKTNSPKHLLQKIPQQTLNYHKAQILTQSQFLTKKLSKFNDVYLSVSKQIRNGLIFQYDLLLGYFYLKISMLNFNRNVEQTNEENETIGSGGFGFVRMINVQGKDIAVKRIKFKTKLKQRNKNDNENQQQSEIDEILDFQQAQMKHQQIKKAIREYAIYKICSMLEIGPKIIFDSAFDLHCYNDCIEFYMQLCEVPCKSYNFFTQRGVDYQKMQADLVQKLQRMHGLKLVHRDIKPQNILYSEKRRQFILTDFGLTHAVEQQRNERTLVTAYAGTLKYSSPQMVRVYQQRQSQHVNLYDNDIYALQKVLNQFRSLDRSSNLNNKVQFHGNQIIHRRVKNSNQIKQNNTISRNSMSFAQSFSQHYSYRQQQQQFSLQSQQKKQQQEILQRFEQNSYSHQSQFLTSHQNSNQALTSFNNNNHNSSGTGNYQSRTGSSIPILNTSDTNSIKNQLVNSSKVNFYVGALIYYFIKEYLVRNVLNRLSVEDMLQMLNGSHQNSSDLDSKDVVYKVFESLAKYEQKQLRQEVSYRLVMVFFPETVIGGKGLANYNEQYYKNNSDIVSSRLQLYLMQQRLTFIVRGYGVIEGQQTVQEILREILKVKRYHYRLQVQQAIDSIPNYDYDQNIIVDDTPSQLNGQLKAISKLRQKIIQYNGNGNRNQIQTNDRQFDLDTILHKSIDPIKKFKTYLQNIITDKELFKNSKDENLFNYKAKILVNVILRYVKIVADYQGVLSSQDSKEINVMMQKLLKLCNDTVNHYQIDDLTNDKKDIHKRPFTKKKTNHSHKHLNGHYEQMQTQITASFITSTIIDILDDISVFNSEAYSQIDVYQQLHVRYEFRERQRALQLIKAGLGFVVFGFHDDCGEECQRVQDNQREGQSLTSTLSHMGKQLLLTAKYVYHLGLRYCEQGAVNSNKQTIGITQTKNPQKGIASCHKSYKQQPFGSYRLANKTEQLIRSILSVQQTQLSQIGMQTLENQGQLQCHLSRLELYEEYVKNSYFLAKLNYQQYLSQQGQHDDQLQDHQQHNKKLIEQSLQILDKLLSFHNKDGLFDQVLSFYNDFIVEFKLTLLIKSQNYSKAQIVVDDYVSGLLVGYYDRNQKLTNTNNEQSYPSLTPSETKTQIQQQNYKQLNPKYNHKSNKNILQKLIKLHPSTAIQKIHMFKKLADTKFHLYLQKKKNNNNNTQSIGLNNQNKNTLLQERTGDKVIEQKTSQQTETSLRFSPLLLQSIVQIYEQVLSGIVAHYEWTEHAKLFVETVNNLIVILDQLQEYQRAIKYGQYLFGLLMDQKRSKKTLNTTIKNTNKNSIYYRHNKEVDQRNGQYKQSTNIQTCEHLFSVTKNLIYLINKYGLEIISNKHSKKNNQPGQFYNGVMEKLPQYIDCYVESKIALTLRHCIFKRLNPYSQWRSTNFNEQFNKDQSSDSSQTNKIVYYLQDDGCDDYFDMQVLFFDFSLMELQIKMNSKPQEDDRNEQQDDDNGHKQSILFSNQHSKQQQQQQQILKLKLMFLKAYQHNMPFMKWNYRQLSLNLSFSYFQTADYKQVAKYLWNFLQPFIQKPHLITNKYSSNNDVDVFQHIFLLAELLLKLNRTQRAFSIIKKVMFYLPTNNFILRKKFYSFLVKITDSLSFVENIGFYRKALHGFESLWMRKLVKNDCCLLKNRRFQQLLIQDDATSDFTKLQQKGNPKFTLMLCKKWILKL